MIKTTITIQEIVSELNKFTKFYPLSMRNLVNPIVPSYPNPMFNKVIDIGAVDLLNIILGEDDESGCHAIATNFDVECSRCDEDPAEGQIVGNLCNACKNKLINGKLNGFSFTEQGLNAIHQSRRGK